MRYPFWTVDVFTDRAFGGNPLAVLADANGLTTEQMQLIAQEFNLSETTFVLPPSQRNTTSACASSRRRRSCRSRGIPPWAPPTFWPRAGA